MYITLRENKPVEAVPSGTRQRVGGTVVALGVVSMLTDVSSEAVSAILPMFLTAGLGLSVVAYGFVDGLYQGVSAVTRVAAGYAADRYDRPKRVALLGYGLSMIARAGLLVSQGLGLVTAVVAADRIGKGIRTGPRDAMIAASTEPGSTGRAFGVHRGLDTLGAVLGPLVAFTILWVVVDGYDLVLAVSLAFAVLGVAVLILLVPDVRTRRRASAPAAADPSAPFRLRECWTPQVRRLLVAVGLLSLVTVGDGFLYLALLERSEFATHWFPMLYVGTNVVFMALAVPFGRLADRIGRVRVFLGAHALLLAAYASAAVPSTSALATLATLVLLGAFYAGTDGVLAAVAGQLAPAGGRASTIASAQTVVALARMAASTGFGLLWFLVGPAIALLCVGVALALLLLPASRLLRPVLRQEKTARPGVVR